MPNVIVLTGGGVIGYGARNAANCLGRYHLEADRDVNGRLVWRQNGEDAFLTFNATSSTWQAQTEAQLGSNECWLHAATCDTSGRAPCDAATWHWYDGHTWNDRSSITCVQAVAMQEKGGLPLVRVAGCRSRTVKFEMPTDMKEGSSLAVEISERQMLKLDINGDIKAGYCVSFTVPCEMQVRCNGALDCAYFGGISTEDMCSNCWRRTNGLQSAWELCGTPRAVGISIFVKDVQGQQISLNVMAGDPIATIKTKLEQHWKVSPSNMELLFAGRVLQDDRSVSECHIQKAHTLTLHIVSHIPPLVETMAAFKKAAAQKAAVEKAAVEKAAGQREAKSAAVALPGGFVCGDVWAVHDLFVNSGNGSILAVKKHCKGSLLGASTEQPTERLVVHWDECCDGMSNLNVLPAEITCDKAAVETAVAAEKAAAEREVAAKGAAAAAEGASAEGKLPVITAEESAVAERAKITSGEPMLQCGARAILNGLQSRPEINGQPVSLLQWVADAERWAVKLEGSGECMRVKPSSLLPPPPTAATVTQKVIYVNGRDKALMCVEFLKAVVGKTIIFVNSRWSADQLENYLCTAGYPVTSVHGGKDWVQARLRARACAGYMCARTACACHMRMSHVAGAAPALGPLPQSPHALPPPPPLPRRKSSIVPSVLSRRAPSPLSSALTSLGVASTYRRSPT